MDIQRVNSTLTRAIERFQAGELETLWEFTVASPHEMHRKYGMPLPKSMLTAPSPQQLAPKEVSQKEAQAGAVKDQAGLARTFDSLKPKQSIWVSYTSYAMRQPKGFVEFKVGRRGHSKKYGTKSITLLRPGQTKSMGAGFQTKLFKNKQGNVTLAEGDMATSKLKIYAPK